MDTGSDLLKKCLLQIEDKLGWGRSENWHNEVFIELSDIIQEQTHVLLSPTTLKRIWGRIDYKSKPSINTLNTLAQFVGYTNWRDFKNKEMDTDDVEIKHRINFPIAKVLFFSLFLISIIASIVIGMGATGKNSPNYSFTNVEFTSRPIVSGLPNSVIFDFDLDGILSDSIFIQQSWDETKRIKIDPQQTQATGQYYYPGYFRAKLLFDGEISKEHDLFIKSEGWIGTIDYDPIPKYFENESIDSTYIRLPEYGIGEIAQSDSPLVSSFHFVDELGEIEGDNFILESTFRTIYNDKWAVCSTTKVVILGTEGAMVIPFSIPGCISEINLMLNDYYLSGKKNDLSAFGIDLSNNQDFKIEVLDKKVKIFINNEVIFEGQYNSSVGQIVGLRYRFLGAGEVSDIQLIDSKNSKIYLEK
ncbi:MAG: hypothetical protein P1U56_03990 [Saprospiraceae bacterium]|nr:hypothetical protein [Saprospiraceae bacterium]